MMHSRRGSFACSDLRRFGIALCVVGLFLLLSGAVSLVDAAASDGWFGLTLNVDADGFFHPVVRSIKVQAVVPNSPAAKAGLEVGDVVLEAQGVKVAGAKPAELRPAFKTSVGDKWRIKVQHATAKPREVVLTAAAKPVR
jgi:C-terminal processing protease CtpA/Prc